MELTIEELHTLCSDGKIKWTTHILMRLQKRSINPSDVRRCIMTGKIIEQYAKDYPYPSCLVFGLDTGNKSLDVVTVFYGL